MLYGNAYMQSLSIEMRPLRCMTTTDSGMSSRPLVAHTQCCKTLKRKTNCCAHLPEFSAAEVPLTERSTTCTPEAVSRFLLTNTLLAAAKSKVPA